MISVLALDIAPHGTGYAVGKPDICKGGRAGWGMFRKEMREDMEGKTFLNFWKHLEKLHARHSFTHFAWEKIVIIGNNYDLETKAYQLGIKALLELFGEIHGIATSDVPVKVWRLLAYGMEVEPPHYRVNDYQRTKFWKELAIQWAASMGWTVTEHDEAEALAVLHHTLHCVDRNYEAFANALRSRREQDAVFKRGTIHG